MMTAADKFTWTTYDTLLRRDFVSFAQRCFRELSPRTQFMMNWHIEIIAAKLMAPRAGQIRALIICSGRASLSAFLSHVETLMASQRRSFRRQFVGELMPPGYPCDEPSALPGGDTKDLRRRIVPETPGGKGDRRQQRLQITRRHVHIQTLFIKHVNCKTCFVVVWYSTKIKTERDVIQILQYFRTRYSCLR